MALERVINQITSSLSRRKLWDAIHKLVVSKFGSSSEIRGFKVVSGGVGLKDSVLTLY